MATLEKNRKTRKPATEVHGTVRWVGGCPTQGALDAGDACLEIKTEGSTTYYYVETIRDEDGLGLGFKLTKIDGLMNAATYDLESIAGGFRCDCPDAVFCDRPGGCKHARGLAAALEAAGL